MLWSWLLNEEVLIVLSLYYVNFHYFGYFYWIINQSINQSMALSLSITTHTGIQGMNDCDDDSYPYDFCSDMGGSFMEGAYQVIKWQPFQPKTWASLLDHNYKEL